MHVTFWGTNYWINGAAVGGGVWGESVVGWFLNHIPYPYRMLASWYIYLRLVDFDGINDQCRQYIQSSHGSHHGIVFLEHFLQEGAEIPCGFPVFSGI